MFVYTVSLTFVVLQPYIVGCHVPFLKCGEANNFPHWTIESLTIFYCFVLIGPKLNDIIMLGTCGAQKNTLATTMSNEITLD